MTSDEFAIGYAVGLIVGEGSFTADRRQPALSVKMHERDRLPLEHLQRVFGGTIFGPYHHGERRYYMYLLRGPALRSSIPVILERMPECHKRDLLLAWVARHRGVVAGETTANDRAQPGAHAPTPQDVRPARLNAE